MKRHIALIPAAGSGRRFGRKQAKQYQLIDGKPILFHTLERLNKSFFQSIYVVGKKDSFDFASFKKDYESFFPGVIFLPLGGEERSDTVQKAVFYLFQQNKVFSQDWLWVHDAVRCLIQEKWLQTLKQVVEEKNHSAILASKVTDTVKKAEPDKLVIATTIQRDDLYLAQTPQVFPAGVLAQALEGDRTGARDEAMLVEKLGQPVELVLSDGCNLKVTYAEDLDYAAFLLRKLKNNV